MTDDADRSEGPTYRGVDGLAVGFDGGVLRLTLDRPDKRNAVNDEIMGSIVAALDAAVQDEEVRVVVLAGTGDHFCAGADIVARNAPGGGRPRVGSIQRRVATTAHRLLPTLVRAQIPVVCRVQGFAAGIGLHLALAADFAVCAEDARLWEPFMARGFTPDSGGTWLLPRVAGLHRARRMLLLGEELSGREAADAEIVDRAVPLDRLDDEVEALVARLAAAPTVAYGLAKRLIHDGLTNEFDPHLQEEAFALELSSRSDDFKEGLGAFREKRDPEFRGR